jgi:hypothetical protein
MLPHLLPQRSMSGGGDRSADAPRPGHDYSRISAKVVSTPEPAVLHPAPMQVVLWQETPKRELEAAPEGLGVPWIDQLVPFHFSARVFVAPPLTELPTAVQEVSVAQEMSWKTLLALPDGLGVLCTVQVEPL